MINGVILKGICVVIPETLKKALEQLHANHVGIVKTKLMACESIYWTNINDDIEQHIKNALHVLIFSKHNQKKILYTMKSQPGHGR